MDQISPPIRILLAAVVVLAALWALVLRPSDDAAAPAPTPVTAAPADTGAAADPNGPAANTGLGKAVQSAEGASQTSDQTNAKIDAASGGETANAPATTAADPAAPTSPAAKPEAEKAETDGVPTWVDQALGNKVVALLFWDKSASDDRRTHDAFKDAFAPKSSVVTRSVPIAKVAKYGAVARGVDVSQSPTLVIVDKDKAATALVGYSNLDAINQAIIDARLVQDNPAVDTAVGRQMQKACSNFMPSTTLSYTDTTPVKEYKAGLADVSASLAATMKASPTPAGGPLKAQATVLRKLVKSEQGVIRSIKSSALNGKLVDGTAVRKAQGANDAFAAKASLQLNAVGVTGCN